jgi:hypothetical protein
VVAGRQLPVRESGAEILQKAGVVITQQNGAKAFIVNGDQEVADGTLAVAVGNVMNTVIRILWSGENAGLCHRDHLV